MKAQHRVVLQLVDLVNVGYGSLDVWVGCCAGAAHHLSEGRWVIGAGNEVRHGLKRLPQYLIVRVVLWRVLA